MYPEDADNGEELDRIVAEKAGWKAINLNDNPNGMRVKGPNWRIVGPEGQGESDYLGSGWTPEDAWSKSMFPRYATNVNAAQYLIERLPENLAVYINFSCVTKKWDVLIKTHDPATHSLVVLGHGWSKMLSRAICWAWLEWKDKIAATLGREG